MIDASAPDAAARLLALALDRMDRRRTVSSSHTHHLRVVLVVELGRVARWDEANQELAALGPLEPWTAICLALGLAGRCPWSSYPYADY